MRHKKWNVWNRENIEKVKRDERLHREEIEANAKKSRDINSEQLLETLKGNIDHEVGVEEELGSSAVVAYQVDRQAENEEYRREREEKELLQKRMEGSAPFALGDGSAEMKKIKPWYMEKNDGSGTKVTIGGKQLRGEAAQAALDRDMARKYAEDPMAEFMHFSQDIGSTRRGNGPSGIGYGNDHEDERRGEHGKAERNKEFPGFDHLSGFMVSGSEISEKNDCEHAAEYRHSGKRVHRKKDKKKSKDKDKTRTKKSKRSRNHESCRSSSSSDAHVGSDDTRSSKRRRSVHNSSASTHLSPEEMLLLRQKRTEREKNERLRESLLASRNY